MADNPLMEPIESLSVKEVAWILKVSPQTVYGWTYAGRIEFFKVIGSVRILKSELERILEKSEEV